MLITRNIIRTIFFLLISLYLISCSSNNVVYIVYGENASKTEIITAEFLKDDIEKVRAKEVRIVSSEADYSKADIVLVVGTIESNKTITKLANEQSIILSENFPGEGGGIWATVNENKHKQIILAGSDVQGMRHAVYQYCKEILGVDPFEYWSGKKPTPVNDIFTLQNKVIPPPEIPLLCYFENDVDELANVKKPLLEYDWENYTEMINSLVRIKYNAIQLFDMLGRPEFFLRPEYQAIRPDYNIRLSYIDSMITYAQDMGMQIQIDMALGYQIKPMEQAKADCWAKNKQEWIDTWRYYMEETPIGKADIFALRPRNQVWDWEYKSSCGEDKIEVFNEVYAELDKVINEYKPEATKVVICYHDGMEMFNNGFNPPEDWIIAWSDDGWCDFDYWPESTRNYKFGTYMHAGFWLNHTVHDPCPVKIDTVMKKMVRNYGANKYCMVNGQQFRPFLLNIEAFSELADNVNDFNGEAFYNDWATRYFGKSAAQYAVLSLKKLHAAQFDNVGYVQHLWEIREAIAYLSDESIERPGKPSIPSSYGRVENDYAHVDKRFQLLGEALAYAQQGYELLGEENIFYHDYILLPIKLYSDLLTFERELHHMAKLKKQFEDTGDRASLMKAIERISAANNLLQVVYERRIEGDKNHMWKGWYDPANRRPNNGFPTMEMLNQVEVNLKSLE